MASSFLSLAEPDTAPTGAPPANDIVRHHRARTVTTQDHPEWLRTRRQIRRAAARLIGERGVLRATPRAIVRAAGLPGITLSECYPTREALLADIMSRHLDGLTCWVIAARDAAGQEGAAVQMEAMIGAFLASALAERNEHRLLLQATDLLTPRAQAHVRLRCNGLAALFGEALAETVPQASGPAVKLASLTLMSALSCAVLWFDPDGSVAVSGYARMLVGMAVEGARGSVLRRGRG
ncbi:MAG: TetR family transcriptional regulator [Acetobacteraceae bacterium]|nr:TetR family transcriptional regulator [Acetobacteraceae bacterium]